MLVIIEHEMSDSIWSETAPDITLETAPDTPLDIAPDTPLDIAPDTPLDTTSASTEDLKCPRFVKLEDPKSGSNRQLAFNHLAQLTISLR